MNQRQINPPVEKGDGGSTASRRTRLAPSPTGSLHLGNLRTFLWTWLAARVGGWSIVLRMEDLDAGRVRPGASESIVETLRWLGLDWDGPMLTQSDDLNPYREAMVRLAAARRVYACDLSRAEIRAALSAPHSGEHGGAFPARLRPSDPAEWGFDGGVRSHRVAVSGGTVRVADRIVGSSDFAVAAEVGDFIVWTRDQVPSYQLAVTVDDARQGITDVVRGDDLLPSAARQQLLHDALGSAVPRWWHLSLVLEESGRRLAKRDGTHQLAALREAGASAERTVGLLGHWLGLLDRPEAIAITDLLATATAQPWAATLREGDETTTTPPLPAVLRESVTLHERDLQWLTGSTATPPTPPAAPDE